MWYSFFKKYGDRIGDNEVALILASTYLSGNWLAIFSSYSCNYADTDLRFQSTSVHTLFHLIVKSKTCCLHVYMSLLHLPYSPKGHSMPRTCSLLQSGSTESYTRKETAPVSILRWISSAVASGDPWHMQHRDCHAMCCVCVYDAHDVKW